MSCKHASFQCVGEIQNWKEKQAAKNLLRAMSLQMFLSILMTPHLLMLVSVYFTSHTICSVIQR